MLVGYLKSSVLRRHPLLHQGDVAESFLTVMSCRMRYSPAKTFSFLWVTQVLNSP